MSLFQYINRKLTKNALLIQGKLVAFNSKMNSRKRIKDLLRNNQIPKLTTREDREVKAYFKSKGFNLDHTDWHAYYKVLNGGLYNEYIPLGLFKTKISPYLNQKLQWPALLDKNLIYRIFSDYEQPKRVLQKINGFYYINDMVADKTLAIEVVINCKKQLIIKPSIESGGGKKVVAFSINNGITTYKDMSVEALFKLYKDDFIIQEFVEQSSVMKSLNPTSLNTLRVMSYLNNTGVHILSTTARIGSINSNTDNYKSGGMICGVNKDGQFKSKGYINGKGFLDKTSRGIKLNECVVPNFNLVTEMVKSMHQRVPYFKLVSWDIAINKRDKPVLVEYNTYNQGLEIQIVHGPLFGQFTDEILSKYLESKSS